MWKKRQYVKEYSTKIWSTSHWGIHAHNKTCIICLQLKRKTHSFFHALLLVLSNTNVRNFVRKVYSIIYSLCHNNCCTYFPVCFIQVIKFITRFFSSYINHKTKMTTLLFWYWAVLLMLANFSQSIHSKSYIPNRNLIYKKQKQRYFENFASTLIPY